MADFLKSLPKRHSLTSFWRCSRRLFLLACQAVSDVLMQVSSQTCSCTEKDGPREGKGRGGCVEQTQNQQLSLCLLSYLPTQPVERHTDTALADTAKLSWHLSPLHHRETSLSSHLHLCAKPSTHQEAAAAMSTLNWPAVWVVRATNYLRSGWPFLFDSCSNHIGAHNGLVHDRACMSRMQMSEHCPCPYILEPICTFPFLIQDVHWLKIQHMVIQSLSEALLAGNRSSQDPTLNQPDGWSTNYLHWTV